MTSPAAWHPDPYGRHEHRYWDGLRWTEHVSDGGRTSIDTPAAAPTPRSAPRGLLPAGVVQLMERFGRFRIDIFASNEDPGDLWDRIQQPIYEAGLKDREAVIRSLADTCIPVGGWAAYGAAEVVIDLWGPTPQGPDWPRLVDAAIDFFRANFVPPMRTPKYMWDRFTSTGGRSNTWLPLRPPPQREDAVITPLHEGETRRVLKLAPAPDANLILVRQQGDEYVAVIDAAWSNDDPTRSESDWKRAANLYDLFYELGWSTQVWDWAHPEMEPFIPAPRALI